MTGSPPPTDTRREVREGLLLPIAIPLVALVTIALVLFGFSRVLLSLSHHAATAVALVVAVSIMAVATIVATRERQSNGSLFTMIGAVAGVAMLAGGIAIVTIGNGEKPAGPAPQAVSLVAPKGAGASGYAQTTLSFEAGKPTDLEFDNQDPAVQHNVVIFAEDPAKNPQAAALFTGDVVTGPVKTTYHVPALQAGTYYFHCEVHPTVMIGTITVGAGGGGLTVTASGLKFDTNELDLTAGQPTKITFDNKDAGTLHNIAIYTDSSASKALFQGEQIAGVSSTTYTVPALQPGTYYFHCDVHPSLMFGTVVVSASGGASPGSPGAATPSASP